MCQEKGKTFAKWKLILLSQRLNNKTVSKKANIFSNLQETKTKRVSNEAIGEDNIKIGKLTSFTNYNFCKTSEKTENDGFKMKNTEKLTDKHSFNSSSVPLDTLTDTSFQASSFENGFFPYLLCYWRIKNPIIPIGKYRADIKTPIVTNNEYYCHADHFSSLKPETSVETAILDCYIVAKIKEFKNIIYLLIRMTNCIFQHTKNAKSLSEDYLQNSTIEQRLYKKLLLPYIIHDQ